MHLNPEQEQERQVRGIAIASLDTQIKRLSKLSYMVKSQSSGLWYSVVRNRVKTGTEGNKWTCSCPDHIYRKVTCKHIYAVGFSKQLRKQILTHDVVSPILTVPSQLPVECKRCSSDKIVKDGINHNKHNSLQRYWCKVCGHKFVINYGFERAKANPKAITAALDLYFKGVSLRKVCDHLQQFYGVKVSHVAVIKWIRKFVREVKPFVDNLKLPHMSGVYHVDEMMVHVRKSEITSRGHYQWLWNLMDDTTRFWISAKISENRAISDARAILKDAKDKTGIPKALVHDGLPSYDPAFQKEYFTLKKPRAMNVRSISVRHEGLNSKIERLNGTVRDREVVMRGLDNSASAEQLIEAMRIIYNYCRVHQSTKKTPAEMAGIKVQLDVNKIESLMRIAAKNKDKLR